MAESPTREQVLVERPDIESFIERNDANLDIYDYISKALAQVKRDVEDVKGIKWSRVYDTTNLIYFLDADDEAHNQDRIHNLIILLTVAKAFEDFAINRNDDGIINSVYQAYMTRYDRSLDEVKLSVDWDDSGAISECEEEETTQVFMRR